MTAAECGTIEVVTAVGTVAAVVVALSIAFADRWKQHVDAKTRARLVAAGMTYRLGMANEVVKVCHAIATFGFPGLPKPAANAKAIFEIKRMFKTRLFTPDLALIEALVPLNKNIAHRIARAFDCLGQVRQSVDAIGEGLVMETMSDAEREWTLKDWKKDLGEASGLLKAALLDCIAETRLEALQPTRQELHGDGDGE